MNVLGSVFAGSLLASSLFAATSNPFPGPIVTGTVRADVVEFSKIPDSSGQKARVNQLDVTPAGQIFAIDQRGPIYAISADGQTVTPYLDLRSFSVLGLVSSYEAGFQSMAFHPDFNNAARSGYRKFYTVFSSSANTRQPDFLPNSGDAFDSVLLEWTCADPTATTFTPAVSNQPYREVLRIRQPYGNHNAGLLAFNPNVSPGDNDYGRLYLGLGDGGSGGDPQDLAQDVTKVLGKILRIDPLGRNSANGRYSVPSDNPFVGSTATPKPRGEIWALGLRNPQRFHWDTGYTERMFIADIGQNVVEEIDRGVAGANYGWGRREGSYKYLGGKVSDNPVRNDAATTGFTYPVAEYDHSEGDAVTAGYVYRGTGIPGLDGQFIFGDLTRGRIFFFDADTLPKGGQSPITELRLRYQDREMNFLDIIRTVVPFASRADLRFGRDATGTIYLLNKQDGVIRRLVPPPAKLTAVTLQPGFFTIRFTSDPGLKNFLLLGSPDLQNLSTDLTSRTTFTEISPGLYEAGINRTGLSDDRYFFQLAR